MSRLVSATTPFPNALLDEAMPHLKDTEWRVLCVVVRQTLGWHDKKSKNRKASDWLTQAQFVRKTGRDRAALSRAIDALVRARFIEVRNEQGAVLSSPAARRHCKGRLFFALHPRFFAGAATKSPSVNTKSHSVKAQSHGVKSEGQKSASHELASNELASNSLLDNELAKSEYHRASKANTTKETHTKENDTKEVSQTFFNSSTKQVFGGSKGQTGKFSTQSSLLGIVSEYSYDVQRFIALFVQMRRQSRSCEADNLLDIDDAVRLENLLAAHPSLDWQPILQAYFESETEYIARRNYSLSAFLDSYNFFLLKKRPNRYTTISATKGLRQIKDRDKDDYAPRTLFG